MSVLKYPIGNRGKKSLWLTDEDLSLFQLMWDFKVLSLYQIEYFVERSYGMKRNSLRKKLTRWKEKGVVTNINYTPQPSNKAYYQLTEEGVEFLRKIGLIKSDTVYYEIDVKRNYDHFFSIRDAALLSLLSLKRNSVEVSSISPYDIAYYPKGLEGTSPIVVPDWVLMNEYGFLNIECDTGSENFEKIGKKIKKYMNLAKERPDEIHHVLLAVLDSNDPDIRYVGEFSKDRSGRIANLKDAVIDFNAHIYQNMFFYVVPLSRIGEISHNIFTGRYGSKQSTNHQEEITAIVNLLKFNDRFPFEIESTAAEEFYLAEVKEDLYADGHFIFTDTKRRESEHVLICFMEEGGVNSLDKMGYLNLLKTENRFRKRVDKILAVYESDMELQSDVLGKVFPHVYFTSIEKLRRDINNPPTLYQTVNGSRMEEVILYEG